MNDTSPITVIATILASPGNEEAVGDALRTLVEASRKEDGNLAYRLVQGTEDRSRFVTIERWKSAADISAHMQQPHLAAAFAAVGNKLAGAPEIVRYAELTTPA